MNHFLFNIQILRNPIFFLSRRTKNILRDEGHYLNTVALLHNRLQFCLLRDICSVVNINLSLRCSKPQMNDGTPRDARSFHFNILYKWCSDNLTFIFWHSRVRWYHRVPHRLIGMYHLPAWGRSSKWTTGPPVTAGPHHLTSPSHLPPADNLSGLLRGFPAHLTSRHSAE